MSKEYHMIREIREQDDIIANLIKKYIQNDSISFGFLNDSIEGLGQVNRVLFVACGTSYNAGMFGSLAIEELACIQAGVESADEFNSRNPVIDEQTLVVALSQSGETTDVVRAIETSQKLGAKTLVITNGVDSTLSKVCDAVIYNDAGKELALPATKSYTTQLVIVCLLAMYLAKELRENENTELLSKIQEIPNQITKVLKLEDKIAALAKKFSKYDDLMFLGKRYNYPTALEGAHKTKETTYVHAEGSAAEEFIHGPNAIIDKNFPCIFIIPKDSTYDEGIKVYKKIKEVGAENIILATQGDDNLNTDNTIYLPAVEEIFSSILYVIPLQILAYYIAVERDIDVDVLRNISKFVTK